MKQGICKSIILLNKRNNRSLILIKSKNYIMYIGLKNSLIICRATYEKPKKIVILTQTTFKRQTMRISTRTQTPILKGPNTKIKI